MPLLSKIAVAWIAGIVLAQWLAAPWTTVLPLAVLPAGILLLYRDDYRLKLTSMLMLAMLAGAFRFSFFEPALDATQIAFYNDRPTPVKITGLVSSEPDRRDAHTNLQLRAETLHTAGRQIPVGGLVLVRGPRYPQYNYGDRLTVTGRLETPPVFNDFSYRDYLARFGIHSMIRRPYIERIAGGQGNLFWAGLYAFKARAAAAINQSLAEPYASLLNGIVLGIRAGIPQDLYEQFNLTGTSHIIVISGSNISVIAAVLLLLGQQILGKKYAPPLAIIGIALYTLLVGADSAVMRAAFMGGLWVLAVWLGRPGMAINALFFSGLVLSLLNPLILWDVGFQLSFMATLGLIVLVPPLERLTFGFLQRRLKTEQVGLAMALLSELLIVTLAAQIITGPLIVYHFGRLSLVSLLSNLLILPVQPPIMIVGGLMAVAGTVWLPLGQMLGWLVYLPLAWTVWIVEQTARLPFASLDLGSFPLWLVVLLYAVLGAGVWWANQPHDEETDRPRFALPEIGSLQTRLWLGGAGVVTLLVWLAVLSLPDGRLHVAFLDVGQGDAALITLPDGRQVLIDGGPSATDLTWRLGQQMPFWDRTLELVINTHPDADHLTGLVALPNRFRLEQVLQSDVTADSQLFSEWTRRLQTTPRQVGQAGMQLQFGSTLTATIFNPGPASAADDAPNNHSVVLYVRFGQVSFLFPGDIEAPVEQALVHTGLPPATVLKVPHHGSDTSSSESFLEAVRPPFAVISVGADNRFGHPAPEVLARYAERGISVLRTDQRGTIEFTTDGAQLWVETDR